MSCRRHPAAVEGTIGSHPRPDDVVGRDALLELVRLMARQAARELAGAGSQAGSEVEDKRGMAMVDASRRPSLRV